jgi:hypothetical protein
LNFRAAARLLYPHSPRNPTATITPDRSVFDFVLYRAIAGNGSVTDFNKSEVKVDSQKNFFITDHSADRMVAEIFPKSRSTTILLLLQDSSQVAFKIKTD